MRITMAAARLVMIHWGHIVRTRLEESGVRVWIESVYVDDGRHLLSVLEEGMRYDPDTKTISQTGEKDGLNEEDRTRKEVMELINDVNHDLTFTSEVCSDFNDQKIPTLDIKVWLGPEGKVRYSFFEKSMGSQYCLMNKTALPDQLKRSVLTAEIRRRLLNMDAESDIREVVECINKF